MFLKPFKKLLSEYINKTEISYLGDVEENEDPDKLGRLKVRISIYEDIPTDKLPWSYPQSPTFLGNSKDSIAFSVPEIGSQVKVTFPTKDKYAPFYGSSDITKSNKCSFFDEDYPHSYGFKDSIGNFFKINKIKKLLQLQHTTTANIKFDEKGTISANHPNGCYMEINEDKTISIIHPEGSSFKILPDTTIEAIQSSGSSLIMLKNGDINVHAAKNINADAQIVNVDAQTVNVNSGTVNIIAEATKAISQVSIIGNLKVAGNVQVLGSVKAMGMVSDLLGSMMEMRDLYNGHNHFAPHESGMTSQPTPPMTGSPTSIVEDITTAASVVSTVSSASSYNFLQLQGLVTTFPALGDIVSNITENSDLLGDLLQGTNLSIPSLGNFDISDLKGFGSQLLEQYTKGALGDLLSPLQTGNSFLDGIIKDSIGFYMNTGTPAFGDVFKNMTANSGLLGDLLQGDILSIPSLGDFNISDLKGFGTALFEQYTGGALGDILNPLQTGNSFLDDIIKDAIQVYITTGTPLGVLETVIANKDLLGDIVKGGVLNIPNIGGIDLTNKDDFTANMFSEWVKGSLGSVASPLLTGNSTLDGILQQTTKFFENGNYLNGKNSPLAVLKGYDIYNSIQSSTIQAIGDKFPLIREYTDGMNLNIPNVGSLDITKPVDFANSMYKYYTEGLLGEVGNVVDTGSPTLNVIIENTIKNFV